MKHTDPRSIQENEKKLVDTLFAAVDWQAVTQLVLEKDLISLKDHLDCRNGRPEDCPDPSACRLGVEIRVPLSLTVDRKGECLDIGICRENRSGRTDPPEKTAKIRERAGEKQEQLAAGIAAMIHEINQS
jgi:hypothetical protein